MPDSVPDSLPAVVSAADRQLVAEKVAEIAATADQYPGVVILHNVPTVSVEYMSARGLELLRTSMEELRQLGPNYHTRFFNTQDSAEYVPKIWSMLAQNDFEQVISFFQQVRTSESADWSWYFSTVRLLLRGHDGLPLLLITFACPVEPASHLTTKVQRLLDENNFLRRNQPRFSQLTKREREVLRLQVLGHSSQETANALFISVHTVETHRRNIRQKLAPESAFELTEYAQAFNLL